MDLHAQSEQLNPRYVECMRLHRCWPWFLVLGILIILLGVAAIAAPLLASLTSALVLGILLMVGGVVQVVNAFLARSWRGFFAHLLAGVLAFIVGELLIEHPQAAMETLTIVLAAAFMVAGVVRIVAVLVEDLAGRGWVLLNGIITLMLGVYIWRSWPLSSYWVIGTLVGIDLIFSGWSWVMLGLLVKGAPPRAQPHEAPDATAAPAGTH
jgi:uncharacterized membrane protein HdeD (DUF308 family)